MGDLNIYEFFCVLYNNFMIWFFFFYDEERIKFELREDKWKEGL